MQFRTKARAVDLLGKGQIGDLPTAITELWKNGYDAYADNLTAEIYLSGYKNLTKPLFVLTDDGKGMSRSDILSKWLVLGTDSKSRAKLEESEGLETLWKKPRIKAGEKGIGRLSVAFLGSPMLMLTKAIGYPLQALFFDWRLLENFNMFLDTINMPVEDVESSSEFRSKFLLLKKEFLKNLEKENDDEGAIIWEESQQQLKIDIKNSVARALLPDFFEVEMLQSFNSLEDGHGTKFIIFEPIDQIIELTEKDEDHIDDRTFVLSSLSGFTNTFKIDKPLVSTKIPIHQEIGNDWDFLTSQGSFFTKKDFDFADILIDGKLNGNGSFEGEIRMFDETIAYSYTNPRKKDFRNLYGEVPIKLGYSQGIGAESIIDEKSFNQIKDKVTNYGGLYIYRDGFRVLPYGRPNVDFLQFESRRAKRAATAYFSYRRMFGYLDLKRETNPNLKDKSSREGLINNTAYRAFENDLKALFIELAKQYFSDNAVESIFLDKKKKIREESDAIKKDQARATKEKREFSKLLSEYPNRLQKYQEEYNSLITELDEKSKKLNVSYSEIEHILDSLNSLEIDYKELLPRIPKRYKPTDTQLDRLNNYENQLVFFNESIKKNSQPLMTRVKDKLEIKDLKIEFSKHSQKYIGSLEKLILTNKTILKDRFDYLLRDYNERSKRYIEEFSKDNQELNSIKSKDEVAKLTQKKSTEYESLREQIEKELIPLVEHIQRISFEIDEDLVQGAYKAEYETIKYQWDQTRDTAQLGIAVEIIDHEFNQLYAKINNTLDKLLKDVKFSESNQFQFLQKNFKQLEDKYDLLSPLYRISGVVPKRISGIEMFNYLQDFFSSRLKDGNIIIEATDAFKNYSIEIKEPVIYTTLINIINNAFYWIRNSKDKRIKLDFYSDTNEILILNSGERIEEHRLDKIFDLFYSNRPNGRGLGLYLSKESLNKNYLDIFATNEKKYNTLNGACFIIKPLLN